LTVKKRAAFHRQVIIPGNLTFVQWKKQNFLEKRKFFPLPPIFFKLMSPPHLTRRLFQFASIWYTIAMKLLICSDIHGASGAAEFLVRQADTLRCDAIVFLGDLLYFGPRNSLPGGHNPARTAEAFNAVAGRVIACRGNCDSEVDQMVVKFPLSADYAILYDGKRRIFATHGHIYSPGSLPPLAGGDIFLSGHTHIQSLSENEAGVILCNPGSPSLPKGGSPAGYAIYDNGRLELCQLVTR
jgi:putative phosphoesterase